MSQTRLKTSSYFGFCLAHTLFLRISRDILRQLMSLLLRLHTIPNHILYTDIKLPTIFAWRQSLRTGAKELHISSSSPLPKHPCLFQKKPHWRMSVVYFYHALKWFLVAGFYHLASTSITSFQPCFPHLPSYGHLTYTQRCMT